MKMKNSIWNLVWVCLLCSCNSWLDIKLINQSEESELFSTERGFSEALAGVYYDMSAAGTIWSDPFIRHAGCDVAYL